jgi:hypothetical protein
VAAAAGLANVPSPSVVASKGTLQEQPAYPNQWVGLTLLGEYQSTHLLQLVNTAGLLSSCLAVMSFSRCCCSS